MAPVSFPEAGAISFTYSVWEYERAGRIQQTPAHLEGPAERNGVEWEYRA